MQDSPSSPEYGSITALLIDCWDLPSQFLPVTVAYLLSAFLAIFISLAGIAFWRIVSFALHQIRDAENFSRWLSPTAAANFPQHGLCFWRLLANASAALLLENEREECVAPHFAIGFACAHQMFSSSRLQQSSHPRSQRLLGKGSLSNLQIVGGWIMMATLAGIEPAWSTEVLNDTTEASAYTRNCYGSDANGLRCNRYVQRKIPWEINCT